MEKASMASIVPILSRSFAETATVQLNPQLLTSLKRSSSLEYEINTENIETERSKWRRIVDYQRPADYPAPVSKEAQAAMFEEQSQQDPASFKLKMMEIAFNRLKDVGREAEKRQTRLDCLLGDVIGAVASLPNQYSAIVHHQIAIAVGPVLDSRLAASEHISSVPSPIVADAGRYAGRLSTGHLAVTECDIDFAVRRCSTTGTTVEEPVLSATQDKEDSSSLEHEMNAELEEFFCQNMLDNEGSEVMIVTSTEVLAERYQDVVDRDNNTSGAQGVLTSCDFVPCIVTTAEKIEDSACDQNGVPAVLSNCGTLPCIVTTTEQIGECLQQASATDQNALHSGLPHVQLTSGDDVPCIVTTTEKLNECIEACSQNGGQLLTDAVQCIVTTTDKLNDSIQAATDAQSQNGSLSDGEIVNGVHDVLTGCEAVPGMLASCDTVDDLTGGCIQIGMTLA
jgi:hypothetical protein